MFGLYYIDLSLDGCQSPLGVKVKAQTIDEAYSQFIQKFPEDKYTVVKIGIIDNNIFHELPRHLI